MYYIDSLKNAKYIHLDVTQENDWKKAIKTTVTEYGKLDILVNNAAAFVFGKIENVECSRPTTLFAQHGLWEIKLNDINIKLEKGDTFSVPINNKISILCNNSEDSTLNFVSQI